MQVNSHFHSIEHQTPSAPNSSEVHKKETIDQDGAITIHDHAAVQEIVERIKQRIQLIHIKFFSEMGAVLQKYNKHFLNSLSSDDSHESHYLVERENFCDFVLPLVRDKVSEIKESVRRFRTAKIIPILIAEYSLDKTDIQKAQKPLSEKMSTHFDSYHDALDMNFAIAVLLRGAESHFKSMRTIPFDKEVLKNSKVTKRNFKHFLLVPEHSAPLAVFKKYFEKISESKIKVISAYGNEGNNICIVQFNNYIASCYSSTLPSGKYTAMMRAMCFQKMFIPKLTWENIKSLQKWLAASSKGKEKAEEKHFKSNDYQ